MVSVGSTPTAHFARDLAGVTEVRAGVFMFFDLVIMASACAPSTTSPPSVLATVIGHKPEKGWILVDAGWMAMSRDRGTARHPVDQGYGLSAISTVNPYPDLIVIDTSQEHGMIAVRPGVGAALPDFRSAHVFGSCPTTPARPPRSMTDYHVLRSGSRELVGMLAARAGPW